MRGKWTHISVAWMGSLVIHTEFERQIWQTKQETRLTFRKSHRKLEQSALPSGLYTMIISPWNKINGQAESGTDMRFPGNANLPFHKIHRSIRCFGRFRVEALSCRVYKAQNLYIVCMSRGLAVGEGYVRKDGLSSIVYALLRDGVGRYLTWLGWLGTLNSWTDTLGCGCAPSGPVDLEHLNVCLSCLASDDHLPIDLSRCLHSHFWAVNTTQMSSSKM